VLTLTHAKIGKNGKGNRYSCKHGILKHVKLIYQFKAGNVYRSQPDHRIPGGTMSPSSPSVASWGVGVDDTVLHSLASTGNGRDCTTVLGGFSRGNCIPG
jgi:hypothetical protein